MAFIQKYTEDEMVKMEKEFKSAKHKIKKIGYKISNWYWGRKIVMWVWIVYVKAKRRRMNNGMYKEDE